MRVTLFVVQLGAMGNKGSIEYTIVNIYYTNITS